MKCMHAQPCPTLCDPMDCTRLLCPWDFPGRNAGVGCCFLIWGIFSTQRLNLCLLYPLHWQVDSLPLVPARKPNVKIPYICVNILY